jgi:hypothetical protein
MVLFSTIYHDLKLIFYFILGKPTQEDRYLFCEIHYAETTIVPDGIDKGYPMEINFELLETRIVQMKDELLDIINKKVNSYYRDFSIEICQKVGARKAETPMSIMGRFEALRACFNFNSFIFYYF